MSSSSTFGLGRRKSHGVTLDDIFEQSLKGSDLQFGSILQLAIFLPYFVFYLSLSTILSLVFRGGRSIWWTILAIQFSQSKGTKTFKAYN